MNKVLEGHTGLLDHLGKGKRGVGHFDVVHVFTRRRDMEGEKRREKECYKG
jgi:hypothetical protein